MKPLDSQKSKKQESKSVTLVSIKAITSNSLSHFSIIFLSAKKTAWNEPPFIALIML